MYNLKPKIMISKLINSKIMISKPLVIVLIFSTFFTFQLTLKSQILSAEESSLSNIQHYTPLETAKASLQTIEETYTAVGTVKPRSETMIEAQINAQVQKVHVQAGGKVNKGDLLITLDDRQAASRRDTASAALNAARAVREQAIQGVNAADAAHREAKLQYDRINGYYKSQAATKQELEMAESGYLQAKASLKRAKDALSASEAGIRQAMGGVSETDVGLGFSKIIAPASGEIIKRMVEPGDLALPGKPLISLRTETGFRIEAHVREGLITKVKPGMTLKAEISTLNFVCDAQVEEIIPYADPETRTFLVKALLPKGIEGIYPGMYGKLLIPESQEESVVIPSKAVIMTGQLELVMVQKEKSESGWELRYIKTGEHLDGDMIEVLSGLKGGETVGIGEMAEKGGSN